MASLTQRLQVQQTQTLSLTPGLRQAIALLSLSNLELQSFLFQQLETNPLLTVDDTDGLPSDVAGQREEREHTLNDLYDEPYDNVWTGESRHDRCVSDPWDGQYGAVPPVHERTLRDNVIGQIETMGWSPCDRLIALSLLEMLDPCGYVVGDIPLLAARLKVDVQRCMDVLMTLQSFEPSGIFARTLGECLSLQLKDQGVWTPSFQGLLDQLDVVAAGKLDDVAKKLSLSHDALAQMVRHIRTLDPRPGLIFDRGVTHPIVPDVYVHYDGENDDWDVRLNEETLPKVSLNRFDPGRSTLDSDAKRFIGTKWTEAQFLLKALKQRADNIQLVATIIVEIQQDFFRHGIAHLKPMTLKDVAVRSGLHESTVSRITTNKYMATLRGTYDMKYFFNGALSHTVSGDEHAATTVKERLKEMIQWEKPDAPLSDDALKERLRIEGIDIARRTVTKYRESLGIDTSYIRKRHYRLNALTRDQDT